MKSRELVQKTLNFETPARIPRQLWVLPWAEVHHAGALRNIHRNFPDDIVSAPAPYQSLPRTKGDKYTQGQYIDEWGCTFSNSMSGIIGIVQKPRIAQWIELEDLYPPEELLSLDKEAVNAFCRSSEQFVLGNTSTRPFERLQFIRTMEQALMDLLEQPSELFILLDKMHQFYCREIEMWAQTDVDAVTFMDDWGMQNGLLIPPRIFREIFKPMYKEYAEIAHNHGKYIFMHSDGHITEILPDLIEIGVDALNAQIFCMGVEDLGEKFQGKITFWGEIDRQYLLVNGTRQEIFQAVKDVFHSLYADGGIIAQCEFGLEAKPENVAAVFNAWDSFQAPANMI